MRTASPYSRHCPGGEGNWRMFGAGTRCEAARRTTSLHAKHTQPGRVTRDRMCFAHAARSADTARTVPSHHPSGRGAPPEWSRCTTRVVTGHHPSGCGTPREWSRDTTRVLAGHHWRAHGTPSECSRDTTGVLARCHPTDRGLRSDSSPDTTRPVAVYVLTAARTPADCCADTAPPEPGHHPTGAGTPPDRSRDTTRPAPGQSSTADVRVYSTLRSIVPVPAARCHLGVMQLLQLLLLCWSQRVLETDHQRHLRPLHVALERQHAVHLRQRLRLVDAVLVQQPAELLHLGAQLPLRVHHRPLRILHRARDRRPLRVRQSQLPL